MSWETTVPPVGVPAEVVRATRTTDQKTPPQEDGFVGHLPVFLLTFEMIDGHMKKMRYPRLARKINSMAILDQKMRKSADKTGNFDVDLDTRHANNPKRIVEEYGWPTIELVGKKASQGAWLLVQHADHDVVFQEKCLDLMKETWHKNPDNISRTNIAFLEDRVLVNKGGEQLYGTQFYLNKSGGFVPRPIKDLKKVGRLRAKFGLPSLEDYVESAKKYKPARFKRTTQSQ